VARLVYSVIASLDGYVTDESGEFDWAAPSAEVHRAVNELEAQIGTYLYGRRMYEVMSGWQDVPRPGGGSDVVADFAAIWAAADKVVYSTTVQAVTTPRTRLERTFDARAVREQVDGLDRDVSVGGATLASHALRAGIVDDIYLFVVPVIVGGGTSCWPTSTRVALNLRGEDRFADGTVLLHYRALPDRQPVPGHV